jgi:hypothetical protein
MRSLVLGVGVAAVGPILLGLVAALGLLPGDSFWIVAPFGLLPLTGATVGLALGRSWHRRAPLYAALAVPIGLAAGWIIAMVASLLVDPSQNTAMTLFFALLATFALPWWLAPLALAMGIAWLLVRRNVARESDIH